MARPARKRRQLTLVEVRHLLVVAGVDDGKILHARRNTRKHVVLAHAVGVGVFAKADDNDAVSLGEDGLVDVPGLREVRKDEGAHFGGESGRRSSNGKGVARVQEGGRCWIVELKPAKRLGASGKPTRILRLC